MGVPAGFLSFCTRTPVVLNFMVLFQVPGTSCSSSGRQKAGGEQIVLLFSLSLFETLGNVSWIDMRGKRVPFRPFPNEAPIEFAPREAWNRTLSHGFSKQSNTQTKLLFEAADETKFGRNLCHLSKKVQH